MWPPPSAICWFAPRQLFAYVLAVVVDDAAQRVTHVVRAQTSGQHPRQIHLQAIAGTSGSDYAHVPLLLEPMGESWPSPRAAFNWMGYPVAALIKVFDLLNLSPPRRLIWRQSRKPGTGAIGRWNIDRVPRRLTSLLERLKCTNMHIPFPNSVSNLDLPSRCVALSSMEMIEGMKIIGIGT